MRQKIYFTGSIRGGREDALLYQDMIVHMKKTDIVLTEHIGTATVHADTYDRLEDEEIYRRDITWLKESDILIAECTSPSLGVGYELAYAERLGKPCYILYHTSKCHISAMLNGDPYFHVYRYDSKEELFVLLDQILEMCS